MQLSAAEESGAQTQNLALRAWRAMVLMSQKRRVPRAENSLFPVTDASDQMH